MRTFVSLLIACLAVAGMVGIPADNVAASESSLAQAVNKSGRQRMLVQRIVKAYVQIGLEITPQASRRQLDDAVLMFETQLAELKSVAPDFGSGEPVARLERLWRPFREVAAGAVSRAGAVRLLEMDGALVDAADGLTVGLQNRAANPAGRLVNLAGRQRMLSQRMAKYYLLRAWGIESATIAREIGSARAEFDGALATLRAAPENTDRVGKELEAVALQWEWFKNALSLEGAASYGLIVVNASEAILESMEVITGHYERLAPQ